MEQAWQDRSAAEDKNERLQQELLQGRSELAKERKGRTEAEGKVRVFICGCTVFQALAGHCTQI
jgi:hypothetical protein